MEDEVRERSNKIKEMNELISIMELKTSEKDEEAKEMHRIINAKNKKTHYLNTMKKDEEHKLNGMQKKNERLHENAVKLNTCIEGKDLHDLSTKISGNFSCVQNIFQKNSTILRF